MRLPMDNPIFTKLQEMVQNAPKLPQWSVGLGEISLTVLTLQVRYGRTGDQYHLPAGRAA